jgi:hypothetical protein
MPIQCDIIAEKITNSEPPAQRAGVSKDLAPPFLRRRDSSDPAFVQSGGFSGPVDI